MIGGRLIEIKPLPDGLVQLWVLGSQSTSEKFDEIAVKVRAASVMPQLGEDIWWQSGKVYFHNDTKSLEKVGNSYDPRKEG